MKTLFGSRAHWFVPLLAIHYLAVQLLSGEDARNLMLFEQARQWLLEDEIGNGT